MRKRHFNTEDWSSSNDEPPKKKSSSGMSNTTQFEEGEVITDISGKNWKLGATVGIGGFGKLYEASENISRGAAKSDYSYVAKVEKHTSGPLFVEINCYLRSGKSQMIEEWRKEKNLKFLGMPHYVGFGSCYNANEKYRFLLLPKYKKDLGQILQEKKSFNIKTVSNICIQILDVLEYIHSKGYVHSDIKASNIMLGNEESKTDIVSDKVLTRNTSKAVKRTLRTFNCQKKNIRNTKRNLRTLDTVNYIDDLPYLDEMLKEYEDEKESDEFAQSYDAEKNSIDRVYLVDFGLASKFLHSNGDHKEFCTDERRAHAGTVLFCSRDAHKGVSSRRSDLESLAYNMVYWLTGSLPWIEDLEQPAEVEKKKNRCFMNMKSFLDLSFNNNFPRFVLEYFQYLEKLQFTGTPDYDYCRNIFTKAIKLYAYKQDSVLDFDNLEGWGNKRKKKKCNKKILTHYSFLKTSPLKPLNSNVVFKRPKLRKQIKDIKVDSIMNWSKILTDPEEIIKQGRERKTTEGSDPGSPNLSNLDIYSMNPTQEMINVYNKCLERDVSPKHKGDDSGVVENIGGYTPAMMNIYAKVKERKELEYSVMVNNNNNNECKLSNRRVTRRTLKTCESSVSEKISRFKSHVNARKKDGSHHVPVKKVKSTPLRRTYSLKG